MTERKLVKQGRNALTVTLPAKWLQKRGLQQGNTIYIEEHNTQLRITTALLAKQQEATIELEGSDRSAIMHKVIGRYIEGYDSIILLNANPATVQELVPQLIGMIVEELTPVRIVLKSIIAVPEARFEAIVRRAGHILVQQTRLLEGLAVGKATYEQLKAGERILDSTLLYCLRYLNKYSQDERAYRYFLLCSTLEMAADQIRQIAKNIKGQKGLATKIRELVEQYVALLFKSDFDKTYAILKAFREQLPKQTFVDGLAFSLVEILYNYLGYLVGE